MVSVKGRSTVRAGVSSGLDLCDFLGRFLSSGSGPHHCSSQSLQWTGFVAIEGFPVNTLLLGQYHSVPHMYDGIIDMKQEIWQYGA